MIHIFPDNSVIIHFKSNRFSIFSRSKVLHYIQTFLQHQHQIIILVIIHHNNSHHNHRTIINHIIQMLMVVMDHHHNRMVHHHLIVMVILIQHKDKIYHKDHHPATIQMYNHINHHQ